MKRYIVIIAIVALLPILVAGLLDLSIFKYISGSVSSWISFWGNYLGAIIGASVVYFVARYQIQKQHEQQLQAIEVENKHSTEREMKQFMITTKLHKVEEMIQLVNQIADLHVDLSNDFVKYVTYKDIVNNNEAPEREQEMKGNIKDIKVNYRQHHSRITFKAVRMITLSSYLTDVTSEVMDIQYLFTDLFDEVKDCYFSKEKYKKYLGDPDSSILTENSKEINKRISYLLAVLHEMLFEKINHIKSQTNI